MPVSRRSVLRFALASPLVLAACRGNTESAESSDPETNAVTGSYPITIKHALGTTTVKSRPQRIACVAWANHEVPLALGVVPVGMSKATWGDDDTDGVLPWVTEKLNELGAEIPVLFDETDGIDFESVADTTPDVILAAYSGLSQEDYDKLSGIAPTVAYPNAPWTSSMDEMIQLNSTAMGMKTEGEALSKRLAEKMASIFAEFPVLAGKKFILSSHPASDISKIGFYSSLDPRVSTLIDLGMKPADVVAEMSANSEDFWHTLSTEEADKLADVDVMITYGDDAAQVVEELTTNPLLSKIGVFQRSAIGVLPNDTPIAAAANPSPLDIEWGMAKYLEIVAEAAAK